MLVIIIKLKDKKLRYNSFLFFYLRLIPLCADILHYKLYNMIILYIINQFKLDTVRRRLDNKNDQINDRKPVEITFAYGVYLW